jgi:hypothetical protein
MSSILSLGPDLAYGRCFVNPLCLRATATLDFLVGRIWRWVKDIERLPAVRVLANVGEVLVVFGRDHGPSGSYDRSSSTSAVDEMICIYILKGVNSIALISP